MRFKSVSFRATITHKDTSQMVAKQLQSLIDTHATEGWTFEKLETVEVFSAASSGCFGIGATPALFKYFPIAVFSYPNNIEKLLILDTPKHTIEWVNLPQKTEIKVENAILKDPEPEIVIADVETVAPVVASVPSSYANLFDVSTPETVVEEVNTQSGDFNQAAEALPNKFDTEWGTKNIAISVISLLVLVAILFKIFTSETTQPVISENNTNNVITPPTLPNENLGVLNTSFNYDGCLYRLYINNITINVQKEKNGYSEIVFSESNGHGIEVKDLNSDNIPDLIFDQKDIREVYLFNMDSSNYKYIGMFGYKVGYNAPQWRIRDYYVTRLDGNRDNPTYDLYKIVNYKQITIGRIYVDVLYDQRIDAQLINEIKIYKITNGDWATKTMIKSIAPNDIERMFFNQNTTKSLDFNADAFAMQYFDRYFSDFMQNDASSSSTYAESEVNKLTKALAANNGILVIESSVVNVRDKPHNRVSHSAGVSQPEFRGRFAGIIFSNCSAHARPSRWLPSKSKWTCS